MTSVKEIFYIQEKEKLWASSNKLIYSERKKRLVLKQKFACIFQYQLFL